MKYKPIKKLFTSLSFFFVLFRRIEIFPLYRIIPVWYTAMTMTLVIVVGLSVSIVLGNDEIFQRERESVQDVVLLDVLMSLFVMILEGPQDPQKIDPRLISPVFYGVLRMLPESIRHQIGYKWWKPEQMKLTATNNV